MRWGKMQDLGVFVQRCLAEKHPGVNLGQDCIVWLLSCRTVALFAQCIQICGLYIKQSEHTGAKA